MRTWSGPSSGMDLASNPSVARTHLKLARGKGEILVLPMHREIRKGTLMDIYREALRYVPEEDLRHVFFSD